MGENNLSAILPTIRQAVLGVALVAGSLAVTPASATTLFSDNLQGTLSQWDNPAGAGQIVTAPDGGKALTFGILQGGSGLLETKSAFTSSTGLFTITFDLYANCGHTNGCGAFLWANGAQSGSGGWILSDTAFGNDKIFADAPGWETISYTFAGNITNLAWEDWDGSSYAQAYPNTNALYIRNITLTNDANGLANGTLTASATAVSAPEPAALVTFATALLGLAAFRLKPRLAARRSTSA